MPRGGPEVLIEGDVLVWARQSCGLSVADAAKRLKVSEDTLTRWEEGTALPPVRELPTIARAYKRPSAALLLERPPSELPLPRDFRVPATGMPAAFSPKTLLAIRRARRIQSLAADLGGPTQTRRFRELPKASLSSDPERLASDVRARMGISDGQRLEWSKAENAFEHWKTAIEKQGVLVLEASLPVEEASGFALAGDGLPAILVNNSWREPIVRRTFTLCHECGHLLLSDSGICVLVKPHVPEIRQQDTADYQAEVFCNRFAGALLISKEALRRQLGPRPIGVPWTDEDVAGLARSFKVSRNVVLWRLLALGYMTRQFALKKSEEWEMERAEIRKRHYVRASPASSCVKRNGRRFVSLVLDNLRSGRITYRDVADYLGVRLQHLDRVEHLIAARARS